jgi:hypothetical protein
MRTIFTGHVISAGTVGRVLDTTDAGQFIVDVPGLRNLVRVEPDPALVEIDQPETETA